MHFVTLETVNGTFDLVVIWMLVFCACCNIVLPFACLPSPEGGVCHTLSA